MEWQNCVLPDSVKMSLIATDVLSLDGVASYEEAMKKATEEAKAAKTAKLGAGGTEPMQRVTAEFIKRANMQASNDDLAADDSVGVASVRTVFRPPTGEGRRSLKTIQDPLD